jgi:hypothetical protein
MDYLDQVYLEIKDREKSNFLMSSLKEPEKFIAAVKELIDSGYITNVHWDSSYSRFYIEEKFPFATDKYKRSKNWYYNNDSSNNHDDNSNNLYDGNEDL